MNLKKEIPKNETVILAFSGGPDSVYLLQKLLETSKSHNFKIIVAHFNHKLRGKESDADELFSKKTAEKYNLYFETDSCDIKKYAKKNNLCIEEAARKKRYDFLNKTRAKHRARHIITAHHLDDNLETFFLNFARGSGLKGLKCMNFRSGFLLRPLLETTKEEILSFLKEKKLKYRVDASNEDPAFTRNKIRLKIIPELKKIQPNIKTVFKRTWYQIKETDDFMDELASKWIIENNAEKTKEYFELPNDKFAHLHTALKGRIIHKLYEYFHGEIQGISSVLIKRSLLAIEKSKTGKEIPFGKNTVLATTSKTFFCKCKKKLQPIKLKKIKIPGTTHFEYGKIESFITDPKDSNCGIDKNRIINLDYTTLDLPLYIRSKKSGDKIHPLGMKGTKKIKNIFIDKKIPLFNRVKIPVFVDKKDNPVAVGTNLISDKNKITKKTDEILCVKVNYLEKHKKKGTLSIVF